MLIGISGGIGAGKSVVSRILRAMGYEVYDTDTAARTLMDRSPAIKSRICESIHPEAVDCNGNIDRRLIADIVFNDKAMLETLNRIVHGSVRDDLKAWSERDSATSPLFVECAIMHTSGIYKMCDSVWHVTAPDEVRITRIMSRNGISASEAASRIKAQEKEEILSRKSDIRIINDGVMPVLPQIERLLWQILK